MENPPTPCLWQAPASTQKTKGKPGWPFAGAHGGGLSCRPIGPPTKAGVVPPGSGRRRVQTTNARAYATLNARKRTRANRTRTVNFRALPCPRSPIIHSLAGFDCAIHHHHRTSPARPRAPAHKRGPVALGPGDDDELLNKNPPTPCLWQASASTQKIKRKTGPTICRSARWRVSSGFLLFLVLVAFALNLLCFTCDSKICITVRWRKRRSRI